MASTYTTSFRLELQANGENTSTWGTKTNTNWSLVEASIDGWETLAFASDANKTLTTANGSADEARYSMIVFTGSIGAQRDVIVPLVAKKYKIKNSTTGGFGIRIIGSSGTGAIIPNGKTMDVYCDGTNVNFGADYFSGSGSGLTFGTGSLALAGSLTTTGAYAVQFTMPGAYTYTFPSSTSSLSILGAETWTGDKTLGENVAIVLDAALSADGKYSGIVQAGTAAAALSFGELCYKVTASGKWNKASGAAAGVGTVVATGQLGICVLAAAGDAQPTTMLLYGNVRADALFDTFTVGAPVYMSAATAGKIVSAAPSGTTDFTVRKVGFAEDANTVFFCPSNDYITLS